jgi:hypothetical protein
LLCLLLVAFPGGGESQTMSEAFAVQGNVRSVAYCESLY